MARHTEECGGLVESWQINMCSGMRVGQSAINNHIDLNFGLSRKRWRKVPCVRRKKKN